MAPDDIEEVVGDQDRDCKTVEHFVSFVGGIILLISYHLLLSTW